MRHGQEVESWLYKMNRSIDTSSRQSWSSQDHVETLKLWRSQKATKRRIKLTSSNLFSSVFISFLSIGCRTMKRDATWWSWQKKRSKPWEIPRVSLGDQISRVCWKCPIGQTGIAYWILETFIGLVRSWTRLVRWSIWPLKFECPSN
jgi:hypothetical protein